MKVNNVAVAVAATTAAAAVAAATATAAQVAGGAAAFTPAWVDNATAKAAKAAAATADVGDAGTEARLSRLEAGKLASGLEAQKASSGHKPAPPAAIWVAQLFFV
jgi:hypothetical protein